MKAPLMIREAPLPKGFPPPGPVGEVVLKRYPSYRAARTSAPLDKNDAADSMFRPLFRHIQKNDISMTAPVEMTYESYSPGEKAQPVTMAFLYGDPTAGQPSRDGNVDVVDLPEQSVISISVRGSYDKAFESGLGCLHAWLEENPGRYEVTGPARFLGYNSPFVPWFLRMGEVQLPVKPLADNCLPETAMSN